MQDFLSHEQSRPPPRNLTGVNYFASQVVSLLVDRSSRGSVELREPLVQAMITASVSVVALETTDPISWQSCRNRAQPPAVATTIKQ